MHRIWSRMRGQAGQRGQVLIVAAMFMTALLGFAALVTDFGQMALERRRLQNAVDAGALAGVQVLPKYPSDAVLAATTWAGNNGATSGELAAPAVSRTNANNDTITVTATRNVPFHFGRVLGLTGQSVTTTAKATVGSVVGGTGVMPFGIVDGNGPSVPGFGYTFGQVQPLRETPGNFFNAGNYGFLSLEGRGAASLRQVLANGGSRTVFEVGDEVPTEPGQTNGALSGLDTWAARHGDSMSSSCNNWASSHSYVNGKLVIARQCQYRVILIPVIDEWPRGRHDVTILGFAQMYLTGYNENDDKRIDGVFLNDSFNHPDIIFGPVNDYGTRIVKLTD
jgi:Flp pilus assembly protein TadG